MSNGETEARPSGHTPALVSSLAVPFPSIAPIAGVDLAAGCADFYRHERSDVAMARFAEGTTCAGVFTRHDIGSAPVDWCNAALAETGGEGVRALIVNAGCANSFTGPTGSGGGAANGAVAAARIANVPIRIAGICKGSGMLALDMATMLAFVCRDAALSPAVLRALLARPILRIAASAGRYEGLCMPNLHRPWPWAEARLAWSAQERAGRDRDARALVALSPSTSG
jgi:N-acetylglutamate synthase/N-acetylornithine aminotransferase